MKKYIAFAFCFFVSQSNAASILWGIGGSFILGTDPLTGEVVTSFTTAGLHSGSGLTMDSNGYLYVRTDDSTPTMHVYDSATGNQVASYERGGKRGGGLIMGNDGLLWGIGGSFLVGRDPLTGEVVNTFTTAGLHSGSGLTMDSNGYLYVRTDDSTPTMHVYDSATGNLVTSYERGGKRGGGLFISPVPLPASAWLFLTAISSFGLFGFKAKLKISRPQGHSGSSPLPGTTYKSMTYVKISNQNQYSLLGRTLIVGL